jgi:hypothetical protein
MPYFEQLLRHVFVTTGLRQITPPSILPKASPPYSLAGRPKAFSAGAQKVMKDNELLKNISSPRNANFSRHALMFAISML